jgi:hypothetical protein
MAVLALAVKAYLDAAREAPRIYAQRNAFTECVMALLSEKGPRSGIKRFRPGLLTFNGHADTLFSAFIRVGSTDRSARGFSKSKKWFVVHFYTGFLRAHPATIPSTRELVPTPDGGHFALDWWVSG